MKYSINLDYYIIFSRFAGLNVTVLLQKYLKE